MADFRVQIYDPEDLPKLTTLLALWYRSPLEARGQLDYWLIHNLDIRLEHTIAGASKALVYPDACICGSVYNPYMGSRLRRWCPHCYGKLGQWLPPLKCEAWITEHCMSNAIVLVSKAGVRRCQDLETSQT